MQTLTTCREPDGIATITLDLPGRPMNVLSERLMAELDAAIAALAGDPRVTGILLRSAKSAFVAGANLIDLVQRCERGISLQEAHDVSAVGSRVLRRIETCGKPVAVAINGVALGGGLELCLACHYRVLVDEPRAVVGCPEVKLGLLPGGGGTQRLPRLLGQQAALPLLLEGRALAPREALQLGIVDELAPREEIEQRARRWLGTHPEAVQRWDRKGYLASGWQGLADAATAELMRAAALHIAATTHGNYPAPPAILSCVFEGAQLPLDAALAVESKYFATLLAGVVARNMMRTLFVNKGRAGKASTGGGICVSRVSAAYANESMRMIEEGIFPALIENAARLAGMRAGPFEVEAQRGIERPHADACLPAQQQPPVGELRQRFLYAQALEAARCLEEGVVATAADADAAAVIGWNFPSWTGGPLSLIDTLGVGPFADACTDLAHRHGARFEPSPWLRERAARGLRLYDAAATNASTTDCPAAAP